MVLGLPTPQDYAGSAQYVGVIVGPIAGRVGNATARVHDTVWEMDANTPPHCLHSGRDGLHQCAWDVRAQTDNSLTLGLHLAHGECGLPGNRDIEVQYAIEDAALTITITTLSDTDTPANATSHAYWNLDGAGDLATHGVQLPTTRMVQTDADQIPTGQIYDARGTGHDFTQPRAPTAGPPLDHCFGLHDTPQSKLHKAMSLHSDRTGIRLDVTTNQPGLVLYSGQYLPKLPVPANTPPMAPFSALAIETQGWPDALNHPNFPSILARADEKLIQITRFELKMP